MKRFVTLPYYRASLLQLFIPLFLLWLMRFGFAWYNADMLGDLSFRRLMQLSFAGLKFDLCAWAWFNSLFILMRFIPFSITENKAYRLTANIVYVISNSLMLLPALADIPFFRFNGSHLRWHALTTIWSEPEMGQIVVSFAKDYWWGFLLGLFLIVILSLAVFGIHLSPHPFSRYNKTKRASLRSVIFILSAIGTFLCIRGHIGPGRPLAIGDAVWGTSEASQMNVVLNTPFCILRSFKSNNHLPEMNFYSEAELESLRSSIHHPAKDASLNRKNIMVVTLESGSPIWIDSLNPVKGDTIRGLQPFLDSLASKSAVFPNTFTTGVRSIEGITNIFIGVPTFGDMILMTSPYYANKIDSPASLLKQEGYSTRFYFGGNHGSFHIDQTLNVAGFEQIISREEYGLDRDFDGKWGVWDHKMGAYAVEDLSKLPQPFFAGWFTLNPHAPHGVPQNWGPSTYKAKDIMRRTIEYEDCAIREFFRLAEKQPWYSNTIFIIVGDHGFRDLPGTTYDSRLILPRMTLMIFTPDGSLPPQRVDSRFVNQFDLAPTILSLAGYPKDYVALGRNILAENADTGYAFMYIKGGYQIVGAKYALRLSVDLKNIEGVYDPTTDLNLEHPLSKYDQAEVAKMHTWAKAFMQDYTDRLNKNHLSL